jgi:alpha-mannosidase
MSMPALAPSPVEAQILQQLGVPDDASGVLLLGMDAHLDWDWLNTFQKLLVTGNGAPQGGVQAIMKSAWSLMASTQGVPAYYYSVCEMGFLRAAIATVPSLLPDFQSDGLVAQLGLEGGGLTSPDNLLPHGEAFIRNYLVGQSWQQATLGLSTTFAHLPDDFGHDAQLRVVLEAMGFAGVCFSRVPGSNNTVPLDGSTSLYDQLMAKANDFVWQASDGAQVLAHLLPFTYSQGKVLAGEDSSKAVSTIDGFLKANQPGSPTPDGSGRMVLRLYQPSTTTVDVTLAIAGAADGATLQPMTALEQPLDAPTVPITGGIATVTMTRALATFAVVPAS